MIGFLKKLFGGTEPEVNVLKPEASFIVTFDSEGVCCRNPNGEEESITWQKLDAVLIETNDEGPMLPDVFWLLLTKDMTSGCVIPQGATGEQELFEEMQKNLPGFDNEMLVKAMASASNQRFPVWEREGS